MQSNQVTMHHRLLLRAVFLRRNFVGSARMQSSVATTTGAQLPSSAVAESPHLTDEEIMALPRAQRRFIQQMQEVNDRRVDTIFRQRKGARVTALALVLLIIAIYWYTLHAVKQETFLEEIDAEMAAEDEAQAVDKQHN